MKKIIMKLVLLFCAFSVIKAQSDLPYKPLSEFNKDTTAFVIYNFMDRAEQYRGKPLSALLADLQIPVKDFTRSYMRRGLYFNGLHLYIYDINETYEMEEIKKDDNTIYVSFVKPILADDEFRAKVSSKNGWTNDIYNLFKDMKINGIYVVIPEYSKYYDKYPNSRSELIPDIPVIYDEYSLNDGKLIDVDCIGPEYNKIYYGQIHNHMKQPTSYSIYFRILKKMRIRINHEYKDYGLSPLRILKSAIKDVNTGKEYQLSNTQLSHELYNSTIEIEPGTYVYKSFLDANDSAVWLKISNKCGGSDADDDDDDYVENSSTFNMGNLNKAGSFVRSLSLQETKELTFTFDLDTTTDLKFQCSSADIVSLNTAMKNISLVDLQGGTYSTGDSDTDENFYGLWYTSLPKGTYTFKCTITPENIPSKLYFYFTEE